MTNPSSVNPPTGRMISFRALLEKEKHWAYSYSNEPVFWNGIKNGRCDRSTLCQFTGLRDKDLQPMYEGDIVVNYKDSRQYVVTMSYAGVRPFHSDCYKSSVQNPKPAMHFLPLTCSPKGVMTATEWKIIGNIHEGVN